MFNNRNVLNIDDKWYEIIDAKRNGFISVFNKHHIFDRKENNELIKEMTGNFYKSTILYSSDEDFINEYEKFYLHKNSDIT
jgi:hypothetical protein